MRLIIVSNRLPFTVKEDQGQIRFEDSAGGLVTGLSGYLDQQKNNPGFECVWVGWPGGSVEPRHEAELRAIARKRYASHPVLLSQEEMESFYQGFCNKTIWPLFHYFPAYASYEEEGWQNYRRVNEAFCEAVLQILKPGDLIWVHDYQLMLLPKMLRRHAAGHRIGFFLHIPFPSFEIFRLLPTSWRREILEGMLGADLVGFHTHEYTQYFLRSVYRNLGFEHHLGNISTGDKLVRADTFPLGIDFGKFQMASAGSEALRERANLEQQLGGMKAIISVDRLDYSKGILHRLRGFEEFLAQNPDWRGRVVFIMAVVPSRVEVGPYQQMKRDIDELVGKINGGYGNVRWTPVLYQYRSLPFPNLVSLYSLGHVALITPLRDGMNLVAKEYLACKRDGTGVLILSEMAGAARELGEAILVNPNHKGEIADALREALTMDKDEQVRRNQPMQARLKTYTSRRWADDFLQGLHRFQELQNKLATRYLGSALRPSVLRRYAQARRRLILLDYDGTLVPFAPHPQQARPDFKLLKLLSDLAFHPGNRVFIVSGRDRGILEEWFGGSGVGLVAEHGAWVREQLGDWTLIKPLNSAWKAGILPILRLYADRVPGSLLEEKEFSIAWHYRKADPELGAQRAKELIDDLVEYTSNIDVQVLEGKKVVEIRNAGVNKGSIAMHYQSKHKPDFFIAIGDDQTDEDLFRAMPADAFTVRVGLSMSFADYSLQNHLEVRSLLEELVSVTPERASIPC